MGPGIVIPLVVLAVVVPTALMWAKRNFKDTGESDRAVSAPATRLTSNALRDLPAPPWRVVYEIPDTRLGGVEHVLIGPPGIFAVTTSMEPLPEARTDSTDAQEMARAAVVRGDLDDALARCAMSTDRLVTIHWGVNDGEAVSVEVVAGHTAVDGRNLTEWAASLGGTELTPAQVDLAWQTVSTAIGRPDPLT